MQTGFRRIGWFSVVLSFACLLAGSLAAAAPQAGAALRVGAAVRDITPTAEMFPLTRMPKVEIAGVLDPIHVRVIALSSGGPTTLIVASETGRSLGPQLARDLSRHTHLPLQAIVFTSTHSHAAPEISEPWINLTDPALRASVPPGEEAQVRLTNQQRWTMYAQRQMFAAADEALANMKPAAVGIGYSQSFINVNRNASYTKTVDGKTTEVVALGFNPTGPTDRTVAAIRFNDEAGKPLAFIVNYAVHGTVMHANTSIDGKTGVSADIPGLVSTWLEQKYPGSVAMWLSGAAGDQAPLIQNDMLTRNPQSGEMEESFGGSYEMLKYVARIHFGDVEKALGQIMQFRRDAAVNYDYRDAKIPAKATGDYAISLQLLRIGDIALVAFPGELFSTLGLDIKKASPLKNTIVVNHAWQRPAQHPGYHADDASIARGGFGTNAGYKPGYLSKALVNLTNAMIGETNAWTFNDDGTATSRAGKRVIVGADGAAGTADDNQIVNPAGTVLRTKAQIAIDSTGASYVSLGNGFNLYAGLDSNLGTDDDIVRGFGRFPQSDVTGAKADPMDWRLLDIQGNQATLLAVGQVDSVFFNLKTGDTNDYTRSNLRSWLNSQGGRDAVGDTKGFYNVSFDASEKARIVPTQLNHTGGPAFGAYNGPGAANAPKTYVTPAMHAADPVFAMSAEELVRYFGPSQLRAAPPQDSNQPFINGYFVPSAWAQAHGVKINVGGNGPATVGYGDSWLRTPGRNDATGNYAMFQSSVGNFNARRTVDNAYGVQPAITVSLGAP